MRLGVWLGFFGEASLGVYIRCCGNGGLGFRPDGDSLFLQTPKKSKQKNACSYVRPARWGSGFPRSGIHPGASSTVCFAAPPLAVFGCAKRSLRSHPRMNPGTRPSDVARGSRSKAAAELALILLSGEEQKRCAVDFSGSWPASDGGLRADQSLTDPTHSHCRSEPARDGGRTAAPFLLGVPNPTVGAGLPAKAAGQPTNLCRMYPIQL